MLVSSRTHGSATPSSPFVVGRCRPGAGMWGSQRTGRGRRGRSCGCLFVGGGVGEDVVAAVSAGGSLDAFEGDAETLCGLLGVFAGADEPHELVEVDG